VYGSVVLIHVVRKQLDYHAIARMSDIAEQMDLLKLNTDTDTDSFIRNRKAKVNTI